MLLRVDAGSILVDMVIGRERTAFESDAQSGNLAGVLGSVSRCSSVSIDMLCGISGSLAFLRHRGRK